MISKNYTKITSLMTSLAATIVSTVGLLSMPQTAQAQSKFSCRMSSSGVPFTALETSRGPLAIIYWDKWAPGKWTSRKRCTTVRDRFNSYTSYDMKGVQAGTKNGYPVVCTTGCQKIVFTLPLGTNARSYVKRFKNRIELGQGAELHLSSGSPFYRDATGETLINMNTLMNPSVVNALDISLFETTSTESQGVQPATVQTPQMPSLPETEPSDDGIIPYGSGVETIDEIPADELPWQ